MAQHPGQNRPLGDFWTVDAASEQVWVWCQIHMKVDFISFPTSPESPQSDSVCNRGDCRKLKVCCSPNPAYVSPFPFRSSPWFLIKTRVHVSPRSKQDGQELKKELTWWLTFRARARVIGPAVVGVDVWSVLMSSSCDHPLITQIPTFHIGYTYLVFALNQRKKSAAEHVENIWIQNMHVLTFLVLNRNLLLNCIFIHLSISWWTISTSMQV